MATFVLVHGACHGGWCWDAVVAALRAGGHDAGIITEPGRALADLATVDGDRDLPLDAEDFTSFPDGTFVFTEHGARRALYHDCPPDVADAAIARLRPQRSMWTGGAADRGVAGRRGRLGRVPRGQDRSTGLVRAGGCGPARHDAAVPRRQALADARPPRRAGRSPHLSALTGNNPGRP